MAYELEHQRLGREPSSTPSADLGGVRVDEAPPAASSELELLRAAAHAAVDAGNWTLLRALEPLIDAEAKRAAGVPAGSLEEARARKEGR